MGRSYQAMAIVQGGLPAPVGFEGGGDGGGGE
jgi:hypothetical protein